VWAGVSIPRSRIKNSNFSHTCTRIQLNRFFPIKFGVGRPGLAEADFVVMSIHCHP